MRSKFSHILILFVLAGVEGRNKTPLMVEENVKQRNKAAECTFGNQVRELGSQWIPDLGPPFGVLYCMKCECQQFQRKRRIVAKVQCRNIQRECPEPTCDEPVLLKGRCCKTCPGDLRNPDVIQDIDIVPQNSLEDDDKTSKQYAALLTGRSSLVLKNDYLRLSPNERNRNNVIATGRFSFHKKNLHYSFVYSERASRPRSLQFLDTEGNILEEFALVTDGIPLGFYQNVTGKVCGSWKRVPRVYRKLLKQEKLYVALVWGTKDYTAFTISGVLAKYHQVLGREMFTSLMEPSINTDQSKMHGSGGTAIISTGTGIDNKIFISVIFNGIFGINETFEVPVNVTIHLDKKRVAENLILVKKPSNELNYVEASAIIDNQDMRALVRGRLSVVISSVSNPSGMKLSGRIRPRCTCEIYQSLLAGGGQNAQATVGFAWFYMTGDGALNYNIYVDDVRTEIPTAITLVDLSTKRRTELEDLTPYFENGWANGTVEKLSPKFLEPFFFGNLGVNVATQRTPVFAKGKLMSRLVADARDSPAPIILRRENYTLPTTAVGLAWLSVDSDCHINYDISLSGLGFNDHKLDVYLELLPMIAPGAPVIRKHLDSFEGNQLENSPIESLSREELSRLDTGVGFLKIVEKKVTILSATITELNVPVGCRPPYTDNNVPTLLFDRSDDQPSGDCFHDGKFYQEEAQWTLSTDPCTMCFCQNGKEKCDTMICPEPDCPANQRQRLPGECCPVCPFTKTSERHNKGNNAPHRCIFNGKNYSRGSKFHPFLIPNGFDSCTECVCDPNDLEIKCVRHSNEKTCCKGCNRRDFNVNESYPADEMPLRNTNLIRKNEKPAKSAEQILSEGGCRNLNNPHKPHENGSEYHPYIDSLGFYKCVTCKCNKGNQTCKRNQCDKVACERMFKARKNKTLMMAAENCCTVKDCRKYRHRKSHNRNSTPAS